MMWNMYVFLKNRGSVNEAEQGEEVGEITYQMADRACSDHQLRNGDAAYVQEGAKVYAVEGYETTFRVMAEGDIFQVNDKEEGGTLADFYDIEGRVDAISLISREDASFISSFEEEGKNAFLEEFFEQEYVGFPTIYEEVEAEDPILLRFELEDGTSFRISYWLEANAVTPGAFGTEEMKEIAERHAAGSE
jgi:hypothetical protein